MYLFLTETARFLMRRCSMDKAEQRQIAEINRMKDAMGKTSSPFLKRDYSKAIKRMESDLKEYRAWKKTTG